MRSPRGVSLGLSGVALALALAAVDGPAERQGTASAEDREPPRLAAYPDTLPPGPGREIVQQSCLLCHTATLLTQQHKDSTAWARSVDQMETWGAPVAPAQRDSLLGYLVRALGRRVSAP